MKQTHVTPIGAEVRQHIIYTKKSSMAIWALPLLLAMFMLGCKKDTIPAESNKPALSNLAVTANPVPIDLGTAADFTILSQTGISTTGVTSVVGDMGVSPIAATAITGFGLIKDPGNEFATSPIVVGKIYASNYATPTPAKMTAAVSDMKTAFTTAKGLTTPAPIVNIYAGDVSGKTLSPGLYKWSTGLLVTNAGVTLSGSASDVWVFQVAQNLTVNNGAIIHLSGGAQARNIFWIVSGKATLGTGVDFSGDILSKTSISLNTNAKVDGRLLAQTAVTLIANTVAPSGQVSVSPKSGIVYSSVTITGTNFSTTKANNIVKFNGTAAVVHSATTTKIVATIPLGATSGEVTVTANGVTSISTAKFNVLQISNGTTMPTGKFTIESIAGDSNGNIYGTASATDSNGDFLNFAFKYTNGVTTHIYDSPKGGGSLGSYTLSNIIVNSKGYINIAQNYKKGTTVTTKLIKIASSGQVTSSGENAGTIFSMIADPQGNLYAATATQLKKISPAGVVTTISGFNPNGAKYMAIDTFGNLYYSNMALVNNVPVYTVKKITQGGTSSIIFTPKAAILSIITDAADNVFVSVGSLTNKVYIINRAGVVSAAPYAGGSAFLTDNHNGFYAVDNSITRYIFK